MTELTDDQMIECTSIALNRMVLGLVLGAGAFLVYNSVIGQETTHEIGSLARQRSRDYVRTRLGVN